MLSPTQTKPAMGRDFQTKSTSDIFSPGIKFQLSATRKFLRYVLPKRALPHLRRAAMSVWQALFGWKSLTWLYRNRSEHFRLNLARKGRRVVFVSEIPRQREAKLAFALKIAGWEVIQLFRKKSDLSDFSSVVEARQFNTSWDAVALAHKAEARLFHNFSYSSDDTSIALTRFKPGRVIFDFYDYMFGLVDGHPHPLPIHKEEIARQTFCIDNADALCCRDLQLQYRRHELGIAGGKPLILFPEYCWNTTPLRQSQPAKNIRIVQAGSMGLETKGQYEDGAFDVFRLFVERGCELHIYLHPAYALQDKEHFEHDFGNYLALQRRTGRVFFHDPVPPSRIVETLAQYDWGAGVNNAMGLGLRQRQNTQQRFRLCGSSRMFDYLDAGLDLLIHKELSFMFRTFRRFGVALDAAEVLAASAFELQTGEAGAQTVQAAREALSLSGNVGRLIAFYEGLS